MVNLLETINDPGDVKKIPIKDLPLLAEEIRARIIDVTSKNGGHVAPSLGTVDMTVALHYVLNSPKDKLIWDVGHQSYAHKIITGRNKNFDTLRQMGGVSGFPNRTESEHDIFTVGHSSTSISQALGLASARDILGEDYKVVCVTGDAALAGGLAFEALNNAGQTNKDMLIVLNDNEHSIAKSVGALSKYLNRVMTNPVYNKVREDMQRLVKRIPFFGFRAYRAARKLEENMKGLLVPGILFEELGVRYFGPFDGHDINLLIKTFNNVLTFKEPKIVHILTKKGKGYKIAEEHPSCFHGTGPFDIKTGIPAVRGSGPKKEESFSDILGRKLTELAKDNKRIVAVSAAMTDGTGLTDFAKSYPDRFFDVGIAEGHAVTFSGALARGGLKPVIAVYSSFLQRGYDQMLHDVCLQNVPVVFCLDRAGLVGEDGATHHGVFDIAFLRHMPNLTVMAPRDGMELEHMIEYAVKLNKPVALRYPRGSGASTLPASTFKPIEEGRGETVRQGRELAIIALGPMVGTALKLAEILSGEKIEAAVINARFIKPLDEGLLLETAGKFKKIVTLEDGVVDGGFGSAVLELFERERVRNVEVKRFGLPDRFIEHGKREELFKKYHLTPEELAVTIKQEMFAR